jgi:hypothetical protein
MKLDSRMNVVAVDLAIGRTDEELGSETHGSFTDGRCNGCGREDGL